MADLDIFTWMLVIGGILLVVLVLAGVAIPLTIILILRARDPRD
jgi:hypothetical protein